MKLITREAVAHLARKAERDFTTIFALFPAGVCCVSLAVVFAPTVAERLMETVLYASVALGVSLLVKILFLAYADPTGQVQHEEVENED